MSWALFFSVVEPLWMLGVVGWLLLERRSPAATLAWILALVWLPLVGIPVYLLLGPRRLRRRKLRVLQARAVVGHTAPDQEPAEAPPALAPLMRLAARLDGMPPQSAREVSLLTTGDDKYRAVLSALAEARHHAHLEYYIFRDDRTGTALRDALAACARRGVEVRLLVDALGSSGVKEGFFAPLRAAGGEFAWFNPVRLRLRKRLANFRSHRKIVVVDGRVGFTGGMNVSDDHSAAASGAAAWRDTHLRLEGEVVHGLQRTFLENWLFAHPRRPAGPPDLGPYFPSPEPGPHRVQVIASGPDGPSASAAYYLAAIGLARRRVWATTPYLVPDEPLEAALTTAALRGVDVQVLVPARTDSRLVDLASRSYHDPLLRAGVKIHLYGPPMIHAKTCVVDDELALVGTANLDYRSLHLNFEVVAAVYGGAVAGELAEAFTRDLARAHQIPALRHRGSLSGRLAEAAARLLAPQL